jgi:hypothetical protein
VRRANLFTRRDTRHDAEAWLQRHLPRGRVVGAEIYTKSRPGRPVPVRELFPLSKVEWRGIEHARSNGCAYVLRNATMTGRGAVNPFTGKLYADRADRLRAFLEESESLAAWSPLAPEGPVTLAFCNPELRLYGLHRAGEAIAVEALLPSPLLFVEDGTASRFPVGRGLGCPEGIRADPGTRRRLRVGGPAVPERTVYLLLRDTGSGGRVRVAGFGRRTAVTVEPGQTVAVTVRRPAWRPPLSRFETACVRAESPCRAWIEFDRWRAAAALRDRGAPDRALRLLSDGDAGNGCERLVRFLAMADLGQTPGADEEAWLRGALDLLAQAVALPPTRLRVNGVSGHAYDEFARVYLGARDRVYALSPGTGTGGEPLPGVLELPAGAWRLRAEVRGSPASAWETVDVAFVTDRPGLFDFRSAGLDTVPRECRNVEIAWALHDRLRETLGQLERALDAVGEAR